MAKTRRIMFRIERGRQYYYIFDRFCLEALGDGQWYQLCCKLRGDGCSSLQSKSVESTAAQWQLVLT